MSNIDFKKGFFEWIAAADAEKVHSQTIGWILSDECGVFSEEVRKSILQELFFGQSENFDIGCIESVDVEINDIDIQITCKNCLIVIENKLKSSQHSNQLFKYEYLTTNNKSEARHYFLQWKFPIEYKQWIKGNSAVEDKGKIFLEFLQANLTNKEKKKILNKYFPNKEDIILNKEDIKDVKYFYLTLSDEKPKGTEGKWVNVKYKKLFEVLEKYNKQVSDKSHPNYSILKNYIETLGRLTTATEKFLECPEEMPFVFSEGKTKKGDSVNNISETQLELYIRELRLETLFQKIYYVKLLKDVEEKLGEISKYKIESSNISETNGNALLDFFFENVKLGNITYIPVLQFQGKAIKLGLTEKETFYTGKSPEVNIDKSKIIDDRKTQFAEILKNFNKKCSLDDIKNKLSTPKRHYGFMSFPLFEGQDYWQTEGKIAENVTFILDKINLAYNVFKEISSESRRS